MQIAFHIGANCTDEDRLLKSLLKNADVLLQQGIGVPGPSRYRSLIREAVQGLTGAQPAPDARDVLLDAIMETDNLRRLVLSNDNFICVPNRIFDHDSFYPQADPKIRALRRLFPDDDISLFMGIRNPAGFLQDLVQRVKPDSLDAYMGVMAPQDIRWSDVVRRIKQAAPDIPLTLWCNEDTPLIWEDLIRRLSGVDAQTPVTGGLDMLAAVLTPDGLVALTALFEQNPDADAHARYLMIASVWGDHALADVVEEDIDLPDLDAGTVAYLTAAYAQDLQVIATMPGVELVLPQR